MLVDSRSLMNRDSLAPALAAVRVVLVELEVLFDLLVRETASSIDEQL